MDAQGTSCRACGASIEPFIRFGRMPVANAFVTQDQFTGEYFYDLSAAFCARCGMVQIIDQPDPAQMFHDAYAFFTRTSKGMVAHFGSYADWVASRFVERADPFVVEIGCNDGALLENFAKRQWRHLGIEPSANVAAVAAQHGVKTRVAFFGPAVAQEVRAAHGPADVIVAANVICHIPDIRGVAEGVANLLSPQGVFVFEEPYLGSMIAKAAYDQIYDEHVFIFSARSVASVFGRAGLELIDVVPQATHGGSMRYLLARKGARVVAPTVARVLSDEEQQGLHLAATYDEFRRRCERNRHELVSLIRDLRRGGRRIVGYAATSKSTTVLNYCGLGPHDIEFISDTTPLKQGKFTPGSHIPIRPPEAFANPYPDFAVLFGWNHEAEILGKEKAFAAAGGRWIKFVPQVKLA